MKFKLLITLILLISLSSFAGSRKMKKKTKIFLRQNITMNLEGKQVTCSFTKGRKIGKGSYGSVYEIYWIKGKDSFCRNIPKNVVLKDQEVQSQEELNQAWKENEILIKLKGSQYVVQLYMSSLDRIGTEFKGLVSFVQIFEKMSFNLKHFHKKFNKKYYNSYRSTLIKKSF